MKTRKMYLCAAALTCLLATSVSAQTVEKTLVAQTKTAGADVRKTSQPKPDHPAGQREKVAKGEEGCAVT